MTDRETRCSTSPPWETIVDYFAGEMPPDEEEPAELHLLACASCCGVLARVSAITSGSRRGGAVPSRRARSIAVGGAAVAAAASTRDVRLEPEIDGGAAPNAARLRRVGGGWLGVRVEPGPPFTVVVSRRALVAGRYELEILSATPEGGETSLGFQRFRVRD
jgi:hypothetical protein